MLKNNSNLTIPNLYDTIFPKVPNAKIKKDIIKTYIDLYFDNILIINGYINTKIIYNKKPPFII